MKLRAAAITQTADTKTIIRIIRATRRAAKTRWKETRAYEKLKALIDSLDPENTYSVPNEHEYDFNKNYTLYKFFGKKTYPYQSDAVLSFTSHKDAVAYFVSWMNLHLTFANNFYNA